MGSSSDLDTMREAVEVLKEFGLEFDVDVVSCHRAPQLAHEYAADAEKKGYAVIIAGAGGAAALPGVLASLTTVPVIGVPMVNQVLGGVDALYSMLQMPKGVPVATVGVGQAENAALLAAQGKEPDANRLADWAATVRREATAEHLIRQHGEDASHNLSGLLSSALHPTPPSTALPA